MITKNDLPKMFKVLCSYLESPTEPNIKCRDCSRPAITFIEDEPYCLHCADTVLNEVKIMFDDTRVAYVIGRYTTANSNYKRHIINADGKPLCNSHTRSFTLEYTEEQCNCLKCVKKKVEQS